MYAKKETIIKDEQFNVPKIGEIVQGKIIANGNASVFLDLGAPGTGIIYGKEFYESRNRLKDLKIGDTVFAKIIDLENEDGYVELSLNEAKKEMAWKDLLQKKEKDEVLTVKILSANKGGLTTDVLGIPAFIPVSQLSAAHYPKVDGGDVKKILQQLQKFIGKEMKVKILDFSEREEKLILSEKAREMKKIKEAIKNYNVGDVVNAEVTGIASFGVFVKFSSNKNKKEINDSEEELEGLIHISELSWKLVKDPLEIVKIGQKIQAKIIDISEDKVSLSLKAMEKDPWDGVEGKYKKGDIVEGKVKKINLFGILVEITPDIQGLCHVSEFSSFEEMKESVELDKKYKFEILLIDSSNHRMNLRLSK